MLTNIGLLNLTRKWNLKDRDSWYVFVDYLLDINEVRWANLIRWVTNEIYETHYRDWFQSTGEWVEYICNYSHNVVSYDDIWYNRAKFHGWLISPDPALDIGLNRNS